jgi:ABC-type transport system substrate-binding protein
MILREAFDYRFSRLDPTGDHIDPPNLAVYQTLLAKGPDGRPHPLLARDWKVSDDGLEWLVRLRPDARFQSGDRCDSRAVLEAFEYLRYESFPDRQLWYWDPVDTVSAVDAETLRFRLHYPYSRLPSLLWGTHTGVFNARRRRADKDGSGHRFADGTGPFQLRSWSPERIVVERSPGYAGPAPPLDRIEWSSFLDEGERLEALERGEVHVLHGPPLSEVERLRAEGRFVVHEQPQASNMYLALDFRRGDLGFDDVSVRRAISLALDRTELVRGALAGHGSPAWGPTPPGDVYYDPEVDAAGEYAPGRARALLGETTAIACECVVQDDPAFRRVAALVQKQLARVGVRLELRFEPPFAPFYQAAAAGPAATISKWLWQDPIDALIGFSSTSTAPAPNWQHASVPELDRAFDRWLRAGGPDELRLAAAEVQQVFARELPYIPLLVPNDVWVWSPLVQGFSPSPTTLYPFYDHVRLAAEAPAQPSRSRTGTAGS